VQRVAGFEQIHATALSKIVGGWGSNIDASFSGWRNTGPVPLPSASTFKLRTDYGSCVDQKVNACTAAGGGNDKVGQCKLDATDSCWNETKRR
jgi:hypothetical protein